MRTLIEDTGGVVRTTKRILIADSGGTTRNCKRILVSDSGGTTRLVFEGFIYQGTMVAAAASSAGINFVGYSSSGIVFGSISPTTDRNGRTVASVYNATNTSPRSCILYLTGFSADPTQAYFTTITVGTGSLPSSAALYSYGSGTATWIWNSEQFPISAGGSYPVTYR